MYVPFRLHEKVNVNFLFMQSVSKFEENELIKLIYSRTKDLEEKPNL